jgi:succinate dehydrogenase flavin-adding protein (antitoxin of CptAB toxin-antitoxin module)
MKELDLLLTQYLGQRWPLAPPREQAAFERILELPDPLLAAYLMEREVPSDADLETVLAVLRSQVAGGLAQAAAIATPPGANRP